MHTTETDGKRRVTLFVVSDRTDVRFSALPGNAGVVPIVVDATDLRAAAQHTGRLTVDEDGNVPLPLARIHAATPAWPHDREAAAALIPNAIPFARSPRLLTGVIADIALAGVAAGVVVMVPADPLALAELRRELTVGLQSAGFDVAVEIPGWVLDRPKLRHAG